MRADRRRGAARRAGRIVRRVPRVARRRKRQCEIGAADREFVRLLLAEQDHASLAQPHPALGVLVRHMVEIDARPGRRADAFRLVDVLEADRDAVQRASHPPVADLAFGLAAPRSAPRRATPAHRNAIRRRARRCGRDRPRSARPATGCFRRSRARPRRPRVASGPWRRSQAFGWTKMCAGSAARSRGLPFR